MDSDRIFNKDGFDSDGFSKSGYDKEGFDRDGYSRSGYNRNGYDRNGFNRAGYNKEGYDKDGYDRKGFDADGYDREGFDSFGYDKSGYGKDGFDASNFDRDGYDRNGYDAGGFDREGYNKDGYDCNGDSKYDENGYDKNGYNASGYNKEGYNVLGYDANGYNREGFDAAGYDINGYNKFGINRNGDFKFEYLQELYRTSFLEWHRDHSVKTWDIVGVTRSPGLSDGMAEYLARTAKKKKLSDEKKNSALHLVCQDKYTEQELIYIRITANLREGWAITKDSFCYGGKLGTGLGRKIVLYRDIDSVKYDRGLSIICKDGRTHSFPEVYNSNDLFYGSLLRMVKDYLNRIILDLSKR